ncbi:MAG: hypothetical protein HYY06_14065 [Deltaproteobacteria bacterium]|nr:hypothetical protein [Deltaproteobacteria bacterium]
MRQLVALTALVIGCGEARVAEVYPSIGRIDAARVEGRILEVEDDDDDRTEPIRALDDDGAEGVRVQVLVGGKRAGTAESNGDGGFAVSLDRDSRQRPGTRRVVVRAAEGLLGVGRVTLLPTDRAPLVVTSDVDMTYLETRFARIVEIQRLLVMPARDHRPLEGMPGLFRRLRRRADALRFVSGSPGFFRRHLAARLEIDGIAYDELTLKPFGEIAARRWTQPATIEAALREQVGYKVLALLDGRLRLPRVCREVLLGDDTEMDAYAYGIYRDVLRPGGWSDSRLLQALADMGVDRSSRPPILEAAGRARSWARGGGVVLIGIRETDRPNRDHPAHRVAGPGVVFHRATGDLGRALASQGIL